VHIDNGFMRKNESQQVEQSLKKLGLQLKGKRCAGVVLRITRAEALVEIDTWQGTRKGIISWLCNSPCFIPMPRPMRRTELFSLER